MKRVQHNDGLTLVFLLLLTAAAFVSGCSGGTDVGNPEAISFSSDQALTAYLKDQYSQSAQPTSLWALDNDAQPGWTGGAEYAGEKGYSETNTQESGVDESDKIKTDGAYLYVAAGNEVRIVSTAPTDAMRLESRIPVAGQVDSLYLFNKIMVVLYTPTDGEGAQWTYGDSLKMVDVGMPYWRPVQSKTGILIADVSAPAGPAVVKNFQADGYVLASRLTGGKIYVITQFIPNLPALQLWYNGTPAGKQATVEENSQTLESLTLDELTPSYVSYDATGSLVKEGRLIATEDFFRPDTPAGGTIVSVISMDLNDLSEDFSSMGFVADINDVYASPKSIYLVSTIYNGNGDSAAKALENPEIYQTRIYQLDITGDAVTYSADGLVNGHILNQFSLGEYNDVLRVATTTGYVWDESASNHVFCLKKQGDHLAVIGRVENLAPGERLYSARFIGDKGFLVTFVETDPLFTLDLSDPEHPRAVGELKVPGYSTYLHPIDDDHLLAIGKDTSADNGTVLYQGIQLSVFDISDFAAPKLISMEKIGDRGTDSEALYNHKALTFLPEANLLALPVNLCEFASPPEDPWEFGENTFNGLYVYCLTENPGIKFLGRVSMPSSYTGMDDSVGWVRGIFIGDDVYAASENLIKAASIDAIVEPFFFLDLVP